MKNAFRLSFAIVVLGAAINAAAVSSPIHKTFSTQGTGTVSVTTDIGDVEFRTGADGVVDVTVERNGTTEEINKLTVTFRQEGANVFVEGKNPASHGWFNWHNLDAHFIVTLPKAYSASFETSGGDVKVADLAGKVKGHTSGGDITVGSIGGPVDVSTSGGDVKVARSGGDALLSTSGGDVTLGYANGRAELRTSGGDIDVTAAKAIVARTSGGSIQIRNATGSIEARTSGGSIEARLGGQPTADCLLSTSGGSVTLAVPANASFLIDAETSGGDVSTSLPVTVSGKLHPDSLQAQVGNGGPKITLRSSGGGISIETAK